MIPGDGLCICPRRTINADA